MTKDQNLGAMAATLEFLKDGVQDIKDNVKEVRTDIRSLTALVETKVNISEFKDELKSIREKEIEGLREDTKSNSDWIQNMKGKLTILGAIGMLVAGVVGSVLTKIFFK